MKNKKIFGVCLAMAAVMTGNTAAAPSVLAYNTADRVVDYAKSCTDIQGRPNEVTEYFGLPYADWCQMFVRYCAIQCGIQDLFPTTTYCDYISFGNGGYDNGAVNYFKNLGQWQSAYSGYLPKRGDLIFFDQKDDGWVNADHVGFVDFVNNGNFIHTVEGNSYDSVKLNSYSSTDGRIIGYATPNYEKYDTYTPPTVTAPPVTTPSAPTTTTPAVTTPAPVTTPISVEYQVTSDCGAWLRARHDFGNNRLGILSTNQRIYADSMCGEWVHIPSTVVEGSEAHYEGWVHTSNLKVYTGDTYIPPVTEPAAPANPTTPAAPTTPASPAPDYGWSAYYRITSPDGAWARSYPSFGNDGKLGILNTNDYIEVMSVSDDYGWAYAKVCLDGWNYVNAYVHTSSLAPADSYAPVDNTPAAPDNGGSSNVVGGSYSDNYETYVVTAPDGARLRASADFDDYNTIMVLDMYTPVEYLYYDGEWLCVRVTFDGGNTYSYGFVHCTMVSPLY